MGTVLAVRLWCGYHCASSAHTSPNCSEQGWGYQAHCAVLGPSPHTQLYWHSISSVTSLFPMARCLFGCILCVYTQLYWFSMLPCVCTLQVLRLKLR